MLCLCLKIAKPFLRFTMESKDQTDCTACLQGAPLLETHSRHQAVIRSPAVMRRQQGTALLGEDPDV